MNKILLLIILIFLSDLVCFATSLTDEFAEKYLTKNESLIVNEKLPISDDLINDEFCSKFSKDKYQQKNIISAEFAEKYLYRYKDVVYLPNHYDFTNFKKIAVKIRPEKYFTTRKNVNEGEKLDFIVLQDVIKNGQIIIPKNSVLTGRIEMISQNKPKGIPADLIVGNFSFDKLSLVGNIEKSGAKRYYWVMPTAFVLNSVFFVLGYPLWAVRGGHAKLTTHQKYEIYLIDNQ